MINELLFSIPSLRVNLPANVGITFGDDAEKIEGDGTDLTIASSGAINLSKFNTVQFEVQVMTPPLDASAQTLVICDASGQVIGINKPVWNIYEYTYNFKCMEERYNILKFVSGNAGLAYAR